MLIQLPSMGLLCTTSCSSPAHGDTSVGTMLAAPRPRILNSWRRLKAVMSRPSSLRIDHDLIGKQPGPAASGRMPGRNCPDVFRPYAYVPRVDILKRD